MATLSTTFHSPKRRWQNTVNNLTCGLWGLMMTTSVIELQTGSSGGYCVFNVWIIHRTTYRQIKGSTYVYCVVCELHMCMLGDHKTDKAHHKFTTIIDNDLLMGYPAQ